MLGMHTIPRLVLSFLRRLLFLVSTPSMLLVLRSRGKKQHQSKVRLTFQDIEEGNTERAEIRMNEND